MNAMSPVKNPRRAFDIVSITSSDEYAAREVAYILALELLDNSAPVSFGEAVWPTINSFGRAFTPGTSPSLPIDEPIPGARSPIRAWDLYVRMKKELLTVLGPEPFVRVVDDFLNFNPLGQAPLFIFFDVDQPEFMRCLQRHTEENRILRVFYTPTTSSGPVLPWFTWLPLNTLQISTRPEFAAADIARFIKRGLPLDPVEPPAPPVEPGPQSPDDL